MTLNKPKAILKKMTWEQGTKLNEGDEACFLEKQKLSLLRKQIENVEQLSLEELKKIDLSNSHLVAYERLKVEHRIVILEQKQEEERRERAESLEEKKRIVKKTMELMNRDECAVVSDLTLKILNMESLEQNYHILLNDFRRIQKLFDQMTITENFQQKQLSPESSIDRMIMLLNENEDQSSAIAGIINYPMKRENIDEIGFRMNRIEENLHSVQKRLHYLKTESEENRDLVIRIWKQKKEVENESNSGKREFT